MKLVIQRNMSVFEVNLNGSRYLDVKQYFCLVSSIK